MSDERPLENLKEVFKELYDPKFVPKDLDLKSFYDISEKEAEEDVKKVLSDIRAFRDANSPYLGKGIIDKPINEDEAQVIENKKDEILQRCKKVRGKLEKQLEKADKVASGWSHTFDLKRRPKLRKAIQRVFGEKKSTITYAEYKELLKRKKALEVAEAAAILKEDEEDSSGKAGFISKALEGLK